jgi:hypothetical protein
MRITVQCDGNCIVSAPRWISNSSVEKFVFEKSKWIIEKIEDFKKSGIGKNKLLHRRSKIEYEQNKKQAFNLIKEKLENFNDFYNFSYSRISIRNQRTRWGSCSKKGNLNFNYKLIFLPEKLADYIVVHELCHIQEFNHSRNFWNLVAKTFPDYKSIVKELKKL